jgi:hypothetical protein
MCREHRQGGTNFSYLPLAKTTRELELPRPLVPDMLIRKILLSVLLPDMIFSRAVQFSWPEGGVPVIRVCPR